MAWIWRRCRARRDNARAGSRELALSGSAAIGFRNGDAGVPINSPVLEFIGKNLRGKAFRFGIFWNRIPDRSNRRIGVDWQRKLVGPRGNEEVGRQVAPGAVRCS